MTLREVYETTFDEDVQPDSRISLWPEYNGRLPLTQSKPATTRTEVTRDAVQRAGYEPNPGLPEGHSYCVQCGTVMVYHSMRDCPSCSLAERLEEIEDRLDALGDDDETIDGRLKEIKERLGRAERDIDTVDGGF